MRRFAGAAGRVGRAALCPRWLLLVALLGGASPVEAEPGTVKVVHFSPQGTVKGIRQVTARFSAPMVPLGAPRGSVDPFEIDCSEQGTGRWVDSSTWSYDFTHDLPAGVRCTFTLRPNLRSVAREVVTGARRFAFSTGGPAIHRSVPGSNEELIEEEQAFVLELGAEATEASVLRHASFVVEGIPEPLGVKLISGEAREAILKTFSKGSFSGPTVLLQARLRLPNDTRVSLVWGKGIATRTGVATQEDQVLPFKTRKAFTADLHCVRENRQANCIPIAPMSVRFSGAVAWKQAREIALVRPEGSRWTPKEPTSAETFVESVDFPGPFPEAATLQLEMPRDLRDDAGRALLNADKFPLTVKTADFPPLAKFPARFGILEWKANPVLPVTLRNLEPEVRAQLLRVTEERATGVGTTIRTVIDQMQGSVKRIPADHPEDILPWLRRVARARRTQSVFTQEGEPLAGVESFKLPKTSGATALEVIGIPFEAPGLYVVELASPRLGASLLGTEQPMYVPAAALVTNLSVHFKWGRENSLVWVTTLDNARPVSDAHVTVQDCQGTVLWRGQTNRKGIARIDTALPTSDKVPQCREPFEKDGRQEFVDYQQSQMLWELQSGLLVTAQTGSDLSFVHSSWNKGIESWRFQLPWQSDVGSVVVRTIFDRTLLRAGDTVHMKHVLRQKTLHGFETIAETERPTQITIAHSGSSDKYELAIQWDDKGIAESTWTIPKEAKLGRYEVEVAVPSPTPWARKEITGDFQVQEFRVPLMKGTIGLPTKPQVGVSEMPVDLNLQYLAGGGAGRAPVTVRAQIRGMPSPTIDEFERFTFVNGGVNEGVVRRGGYDDEEESRRAKPAVHQRLDLTLDPAGTARTTITNIPAAKTVRELLAEMEYRDPNGEVQTVSSNVPLWPAKLLVGIKAERWVKSGKRVEADVAVVDTAKRAVAQVPVRVQVLRHTTYSHRKRLVGAFYAYEHIDETVRVGQLCEGMTDAKGLLHCAGSAPVDGNLILQPVVVDDAGNEAVAHTEVWVADRTPWWFDAMDSDRIDLLPEKRRYEPGETARLQVRMPFREATALITLEREGILEAFVVPLSGKQPVIEVPVRDAYAPNMFISALVVRGRVGDVQPTAMVDLGKPAYKLGIAEIQVGWRAHELKVVVNTDRPAYHVRDRATVSISVRTAAGTAPPLGSEVAVVAVDEGLLELRPNKSWDLLDAMMARRGYSVATATAQTQVVGKRHYGLKALPQGGGGGRRGTRELFDTLLLWVGRLALDAKGNASVEVPLNDSLTTFRIVAVATGDVGQFGTGSTSIRSTQDLMLLSAVAPMAREGDRFRSEFTVRNTTERAMEATVTAAVTGLDTELPPQSIHLNSGEAKVVGWDITAPVGVDALRYEVSVSESGGTRDLLRVTQRVIPAVPVRTFQATLLRGDKPIRQPVARPADAVVGRGGVQVTFAPTLTLGLNGVRDWMRDYPFTCMEQRVSRAVALSDKAMWDGIAAALPAYLDSDGLLKYFPLMAQGSDVLTAYALSITHEAGLVIPADVQRKMQEGLRKFIGGSLQRDSELRTADLSIRKLAAVDALARVGQADAGLLGSITIEPNLWPTSALLDWWDILVRVQGIADQPRRLKESDQIVRARLNLQGTTLGFSTERSDSLWWLMAGPDTNAVRLILHLLHTDQWRDDLPRLMRGALARQDKGTWCCTITNAWGTLAVDKFSEVFEKVAVNGQTTAALAGATERVEWSQSPAGTTFVLPWPDGTEQLAVDHAGDGAPWVTLASRAAIPLKAPFSSGYHIRRTVTPIESRVPDRYSRGDLLRVRLEIEAQSDMTWVVVSDPIPAGASHLGTGLKRDSTIAAQGARPTEFVWPVFEERPFDAYRAYYRYVPKGSFVTEYTVRLNQSGQFQLPATRVEALYAPEMFGELPNEPIEVLP